MKTCTRCGEQKPETEFYKQAKGKGGLAAWCKKCHNAVNKKWAVENPEKRQQHFQTYRDTHRDEMNAASARWRAAHPEDYRRAVDDWKNRHPDWLRELRDRDREAAIKAYGGWLCVGCGETDHDKLTLDHINNDGREHRKEIGHGSCTLYAWLRRNDYPSGFQVLCILCNLAKYHNGGVLPARY